MKAREFLALQDNDAPPARASKVAAVLPAGPPPMIATSWISRCFTGGSNLAKCGRVTSDK